MGEMKSVNYEIHNLYSSWLTVNPLCLELKEQTTFQGISNDLGYFTKVVVDGYKGQSIVPNRSKLNDRRIIL